jgi:cytochrome c5
MSEQNVGMSKTTPQQVIVALLGGLLAPVIAIFLIVQLVMSIQASHIDKDSPAMSVEAVTARIKPVGQLTVVDANAPKVEKSGQEVFDAVCTACHTPGALGAPKFGNKGDWGKRIAQGYDTLIKHAIEGIRQMPARGGDADLSDVEVARAVAYMANAAGAKFTPPEPKAAPAAAKPAEAAAPAAPAAAAASTDADKGKTVFNTSCAACHATGAAGAPKIGDKAAWGPRVAQGKDTLYKHALGGFTGKNGMMPAKGGNPSLADADVKAAVDYLVSQAK